MPNQSLYAQFSPLYQKAAYDHRDGLSFAIASQLAYQGPRRVKEVLDAWGYRDQTFIDVRKGRDINTQGYVAGDGHHVLVAFRGSESIVEDWLTNIQFVTDPGPLRSTKVHEGFQDALYPAIMELTQKLGDYSGGHVPNIWVTGHSLGGALASLFAAMLLERSLPLAGLYTYGAPRVGDRKFEAALNRAMAQASIGNWRVVNEGDMVPHLPPEPWFSHAGERILLRADGTESRSSGVWRAFKREMADWFGSFRRVFKVGNVHRLTSKLGYVSQLKKQLGH
ncbi:MAG: lipase family protein [Pseudomonadota bacterium]